MKDTYIPYMNTSPPCARQRERRVIDASELDSKATYGGHQISHMEGDTMVATASSLSNASSDMRRRCLYIYSAVKAPLSLWETHSVTLENVGSIT